ncbi:hypothetical protein N9901_03550 [Flavobacteriaceae bacterium]|nr:hypothetical protein [Flavobacteriaceae bacterium]
MKNLFLFIVGAFTLFSCSSTLNVVKEPTLQPYSYKNVLIVSETYSSNKSTFTKFFDSHINAHEKVSSINKRILNKLKDKFTKDGKRIHTFLTNKELEQELVLNPNLKEEDTQNPIEIAVLDNNIDLVLTIYPEDIHRFYHYSINTGVAADIGNPGIHMGATTDSSTLKITYIITAIDTKTKLEVWKAKHEIQNADNIFTNTAKCMSKLIYNQVTTDQLF